MQTFDDFVRKTARSMEVSDLTPMLQEMLPKMAAPGVKDVASDVWKYITNPENLENVVAGAAPVAGAGIGALSAGKGKRMKGALMGGLAGTGVGVGIKALRLLVDHLKKRQKLVADTHAMADGAAQRERQGRKAEDEMSREGRSMELNDNIDDAHAGVEIANAQDRAEAQRKKDVRSARIEAVGGYEGYRDAKEATVKELDKLEKATAAVNKSYKEYGQAPTPIPVDTSAQSKAEVDAAIKDISRWFQAGEVDQSPYVPSVEPKWKRDLLGLAERRTWDPVQ